MKLEQCKVHVWDVPLDISLNSTQLIWSTLSSDEQDRARKFHFSVDRKRFVVCRGKLRGILSKYLNVPPSQLRFVYGKNGKPALVRSLEQIPIEFNVSHSGGRGLIAVSADIPVGVDIEAVTSESLVLEAKKFLSTSEQAILSELPPELLVRAFFKCWTRKEAYLKGRGDGLLTHLREFDVSLDPRLPAKLLRPLEASLDDSLWSLHDLELGSGFEGAIAILSPVAEPVLKSCDCD